MFNQFCIVARAGVTNANIQTLFVSTAYMGKFILNYEELPLPNKKVYDLVQNLTVGNVKLFSEYIGVKQQVLDRIFKKDPRNNKYPSVSENIKSALKKKYGFGDDWFYTNEKAENIEQEALQKSSADTTKQKGYITYLLPMSAMGGSLTGFAEPGVLLHNCEAVVSPIENVDFAITVYGDSMAPEYPSGSRILIKKINPNLFIDWGKVYVLDTPNGVIVKEVHASNREGCVSCHSINPDPKFKPFDVLMDEVFGMYRVLMCLSAK